MFDNFFWLLNVVIRRNGALACGEGSLSDGVATDLGNVSQEFWCAPVFNLRTAEGVREDQELRVFLGYRVSL